MLSLRYLSILLAVIVLSACMPLKPYRVDPDPPPGPDGRLGPSPTFEVEKNKECFKNADETESCIHFVEFDEFGNSFSRKQMNEAVYAASETIQGRKLVVVYVHGWHHSARPNDSDINEFKDLIAKTGQWTTGIYVGWRGDSIDNDITGLGWVSNLLTFWDRKSTAHSVGAGGGVSELIRKLSSARMAYPGSRLMVIGHSFGGAIVYSAISQTLVDQIRVDSSTSPGQSITTVADLVVLMNPAFEAMRLKPLYDLGRSYNHNAYNPPRLVILTTLADWPTSNAFPLGRKLGTLFQAYPSSNYRSMNTTAIGHYEPFITHQLIPVACTQPEESPLISFNRPAKEYCFEGRPASGNEKAALSLMLTRCESKNDCKEVIGEQFLARGDVADGYIPYRFPISNIRTTSEVMSGHNDIWNPTASNFLYKLMDVFIEHPEAAPTIPNDQ